MSIELLIVATVILVTLVMLTFATVIVLAIQRRHKEVEAMRVLPQARSRIRSVLEDASAEHEDIDAISRLPARIRIVLFGELAASISGAQSDRLGWLARVSGLTKHAEAQCRARAWWQRLEGVRLLTWIGGGAQQVPILLGDPNTEVRAAAAIWSAGSEQPETPTRLIKLLNDERPLVRFAAQGALLHLGRSAVEPLALSLQNPDPQELKAALQVAVGLADTRLLAPAFLLLEELTPGRRQTVPDRLLMLVWAILEPIGYRQLTVIWRLRGIVRYLRKQSDWGTMTRSGFAPEPATSPPVAHTDSTATSQQ